MLIAVGVVAAIGHGRRLPAAPGPVAVTEVGHRLLGVTAGWELFGRGPDEVVRIQLARGRITRTTVPPLQSTGSVSFVIGPGQVIIRPLDFVPGYLVADGHPPHGLPAALGHGGPVIPGPGPERVWIPAVSGGHMLTSLAGLDGSATGVSIPAPAGNPWQVASDGRGYLLVQADGGVYDARPAGLHRVTTGTVAAAGPTRWLAVECGSRAHCRFVVIDPASGARRILPTPLADAVTPPGVISPDGSIAAVFHVSKTGRATLHLLNLTSGADHLLAVSLDQQSFGSQNLVWSPDSRWLFVAAVNGKLLAVNARTRRARGLGIALPQISQVGIRNAPH